jgi:hypothetical protein
VAEGKGFVASKIRLRVPGRQRTSLEELARLPDDVAKVVLGGIASSREPLSQAQLRGQFEAVVGLSQPDELVEAVITLETLRSTHDWTREEISEAVAHADELSLEEEFRPLLAERLSELLSLDPLRRAARAGVLMAAHDRVLHASRIFTDVRPVFDEDVVGPPVGAVVSHQLELHTVVAGDLDVLYVALDDEDLAKLREQIERACDKAKYTREMLESASVPVHEGLEVNS